MALPVQNDRVVAPAGIISKYAYVNDFIGRRTSVVMTGEAFTSHGGSHHWEWGYNDRSELTSADRCTGTAPDQACSP